MPASAGDSKAPRLQEAGYRSDAATRPLDLPVHGYRTEVTLTLFGDSGATRSPNPVRRSRAALGPWVRALVGEPTQLTHGNSNQHSPAGCFFVELLEFELDARRTYIDIVRKHLQ